MLSNNNFPKDSKDSNFFNKTKEQILMDIEDGEYAHILKQIDVDKEWKILEKKLRDSDNRKKRWFFKPWLCALVVAIAVTSYFMSRSSQVDTNTTITSEHHTIEAGTDKATLTLETGEDIALEKGSQYTTEALTSNGQELVYNKNNTSKSEVMYNTLTIPRGGQFTVTLSDGTLVWLNSDSQIKYPVSFKEGATREVKLVYGEAYFDVSPSTEHNGTTFKVRHKSQEVEVFGTEFNIKAYKDETNIYTTLVEGKVAVRSDKGHQVLKPNQQSTIHRLDNTLQVTTVEDVTAIVAWKRGVFHFKRMPLKDIMKVLSRWYDMDVVFENKALEDVGFIGSFNKDYPIEHIMEIIKNTGFVTAYKIKDNILTLK